MRMVKTLGVAVLVLGLGSVAWAGARSANAEDKHADGAKTESKLPHCAIMGEPIDFGVKTMTDDGPVYFCCPGCIRKYKADPAKYSDKVKEQRAVLAKMEHIQVMCPASGEPIDPKVSSKHGDQTVYFCCAKCQAGYDKEPAKFAAKLADSYTYQTKCPIEGGKIDPTAYADLPTGERIYLCCKACAPKLTADPVKYADALAAQGVNLDVKKLQKK